MDSLPVSDLTQTMSLGTRITKSQQFRRPALIGVIVVLAAVAELGAVSPRLAVASPARSATRIAWARGARVYLVPADSSALAVGDPVWFVLNREVVAAGKVVRVDEGGLALTVLDSGSLDAAKHLDRVEVEVTRAVLRMPPRLVIGCASPDRASVMLPQVPPLARVARPPAGYRVATRAPTGLVLVRDALIARGPDTLAVRWFNDAVDQEIALERGELDVAIFEPGEVSRHMRDQPRWQGCPAGTRSRGALAWIAIDPALPLDARAPSRADSSAVSELVRDRFRGDLALWTPASAAPNVAARPESVTWAADPALPDHRHAGARLRSMYLDTSVASLDSMALALARGYRAPGFAAPMRARADSLERAIRERAPDPRPTGAWDLAAGLRRSFGVVSIFTLRCPILCSAQLRPYVEALGVDGLADLMGRMPEGAEP